MNLIYAALVGFGLPHGPGADSVATARRIAASVQLAAQEYRIGVTDGRIVAPAEVDEARLFLTEARRAAGVLSPRIALGAIANIDHMLQMVAATAAPDSLIVAARRATDELATSVGAVLDDVPEHTPSLRRGAEIFARECSSCHGVLGKGDGAVGRALKPPPADLTDEHRLAEVAPLAFYQRTTIGVANTAMPAFETRLSPADRWAVALYASTLRHRRAAGDVPVDLRSFATTGKMSDAEILVALGPTATAERLAAVRAYQEPGANEAVDATVFITVRAQIREAASLALAGKNDAAATRAFDAYLQFEKVETSVRARNAGLAGRLEAQFATVRTRLAGGATATEVDGMQRDLFALLEQAERVVSDRVSPINLFLNSLVIILREGLEAILIIGALIAFLMKAGAERRKRDIHIGVGAAVAMSLLTAVLLETVFVLSTAHREALEGATMIVAVVVLFYVSYWLLSKMEAAKWTAFVKQRLAVAVSGGSAFALASAAFLAVYREGFETVLFYKALFIEAGSLSHTFLPVTAGIVVGGAVLTVVYVAINKFGIRIPLRPFFAITSAFLYYMAFVFAGKGIAELQEGRLVPTTYLAGWPRLPGLGIYPTVESMTAQALLALLAIGALSWIFGVQRMREARDAGQSERRALADRRSPPATPAPLVEKEVLRSLERMESDLLALRAEVEQLRAAELDEDAEGKG